MFCACICWLKYATPIPPGWMTSLANVPLPKLEFPDDNFRRSVAFSFLDKIKSKFETQFGSQSYSAIPFAMNTEFAPVLASEMKRANIIAEKESVTIIRTRFSLLSFFTLLSFLLSLLSFFFTYLGTFFIYFLSLLYFFSLLTFGDRVVNLKPRLPRKHRCPQEFFSEGFKYFVSLKE